jgi:ABC-2 type transport system permease protein
MSVVALPATGRTLRDRTSLGEMLSQTVTMAWRALQKMLRTPEQFLDVTAQPLLFTAMFAYILQDPH